MDYKGQRLAELLYCYIIVIIGGIAWIYGYIHQSFKLTFQGWLFGLIFCMILCIPDWPIYNRNPVEWRKETPSASGTKAKTTKAPPPEDDKVAVEKKKKKTKQRSS
mmetsp:Transcript_6746/g.17642  ORF Transcript_6746/g.17642 Transcript_6746/m.17642 type:complete len:106 (+) Transcript_6746:78-395(+)